MSFLAGRLASTEGAYFLQESKQAVTRIIQNQKNIKPSNTVLIPENGELSSPRTGKAAATADVLPEVLRHSLPSKIFQSSSENSSSSSFSEAAKWVVQSDPKFKNGSTVSPDALNPLRAYVSFPQVTFGPKRWQLPNSQHSVLASTANDLRQDKYTEINPEKLKAAAAGLTQLGSAFAIATAIVFGSATLVFGLAASKLEVQGTNDIRTKGKDLVEPKFEMFKEQFLPIRTWAEDKSKKWHLEREESLKENPLLKELSRNLGSKTST